MDEALFTIAYYQPAVRQFRVRLFHHDIPLMLSTYIGTLKTMLYWPLFALFGSRFDAHPLLAVWLLRLPMVLAGALTVFVFFFLVQRLAGRTTAVVSALLLGSDPSFIVTNTFDWGPVAIEHLLLVSGCLFVVKYAQDRVPWHLALGFFFLGLALWNKAIFVWALAGLFCGVICVFGRDALRLTTRRSVTIAAAGLLLGSLPFVIYNVVHPAETFRSNTVLEPGAAPQKFPVLRLALNGSGAFGYIVAEESSPDPKAATSLLGRVAVFVREHLGEHRHSGMEYALVLGLLALPLWWRWRAARFSLIFMLVAWVMMASTQGAGTGVHHTVLLWPFPQLFVAVAIVSLRWKWVVASACLPLLVLNLMVVNQYLVQFERNGTALPFTDAIYRLSSSVPETPGQTLYVLDWGIRNPIDLLHDGGLAVKDAFVPFVFNPDGKYSQKAVADMFRDAEGLYVEHLENQDFVKGVRQGFDAAAARYGCRKGPLRKVADSNGRPVFEVFRMACGE